MILTGLYDSPFARRVALITESLNSNSIDIAKSLSEEVTDTAWASYLRGDRGIFTRRAVRLLDNMQAREIAELYDEDDDFRAGISGAAPRLTPPPNRRRRLGLGLGTPRRPLCPLA